MNKNWLIIGIAVLLGLVVCTAPSRGVAIAAEDYDAVVVATGDDTADCERPDLQSVFVTQDVCNIQAAVNANPGGKILLKGTFHFAEYGDDGYVVPGTDGTVFITNDIEIYGEKEGDTFLTKIQGGYNTFSIGHKPIEWEFHLWDEILSSPDNAEPVKATIQNIEFENPLYVPIRIWATTGSTINGNRIIDGRSADLTELCGPCHAQGMPILVAPPGFWDYDNPHLISGKISIKENYLDGRYRRAEPNDPWAVPSDGILIRGLTGSGIWVVESVSDITIKENEIHNMWGGINAYGNAGITRIEENLIDLPAEDPDLYGLDLIVGIDVCGWCWNYAHETANYIIKENDITLGGYFSTGVQWTFGIWVDGILNASEIVENKINLLSDGFVGISIWETADNEVVENEISGDGQYGVILGHLYVPSYNDGNTIRENTIAGFSAAISDYYLGEGVTNNLFYIDEDDMVLDESGNDTNTIYRYD